MVALPYGISAPEENAFITHSLWKNKKMGGLEAAALPIKFKISPNTPLLAPTAQPAFISHAASDMISTGTIRVTVLQISRSASSIENSTPKKLDFWTELRIARIWTS